MHDVGIVAYDAATDTYTLVEILTVDDNEQVVTRRAVNLPMIPR